MPADPAEAARVLAGGGLVCIPTESTYGLAVDLRRTDAIARLGALKRARPGDAPYALIAPDLAAARALARVWPETADRMAARHWPGPLTLVVPARGDLPPDLIGPGGGVGVRLSSHPIASAVARALGAPITATSANRSGATPATTLEEARAALAGEVDLYLDGGRCADPPSTVVAIADGGAVTLLRAGAVDPSDLATG
jgi:L-threonylcarbamoyladenylate synthase